MRLLKIESLPKAKDWVDKDVIMLHACFQILKDSVEKEHVDTHLNYEFHKKVVDEVRFLYNWWLKRMDMVHTYEENDEDTEMLLRLMKIRTALWT